MDNFEEEVQYFIDLVTKNINQVVTSKPEGISKEEMIFFNWNMSRDGQQLVIYNQEKDSIYDISLKKIQKFEFQKVNKENVLYTIDILTKYVRNEITFKKFLHLFCQENKIVK